MQINAAQLNFCEQNPIALLVMCGPFCLFTHRFMRVVPSPGMTVYIYSFVIYQKSASSLCGFVLDLHPQDFHDEA